MSKVAENNVYDNIGDMAYEDAVELAKLGDTIVEGGYLQTILINADRIDTGTLNAGNVTISSDDGTTFNLQGNDLTIDTKQFILDSAGNADFSGNLNSASGTFKNELSAVSGQIILDETDFGGEVSIYNPEGDKILARMISAENTPWMPYTTGNSMGVMEFYYENYDSPGLIVGNGDPGGVSAPRGEINFLDENGVEEIALKNHGGLPIIKMTGFENILSLEGSYSQVVFQNLPTSDPTTAGQVWNDSGTLKISAG
jgi:hypothetical protein